MHHFLEGLCTLVSSSAMSRTKQFKSAHQDGSPYLRSLLLVGAVIAGGLFVVCLDGTSTSENLNQGGDARKRILLLSPQRERESSGNDFTAAANVQDAELSDLRRRLAAAESLLRGAQMNSSDTTNLSVRLSPSSERAITVDPARAPKPQPSVRSTAGSSRDKALHSAGGPWGMPPATSGELCPRMVWARGLAAQCCDISADPKGWHWEGQHEVDGTDWGSVKLPPSGLVYVGTANFAKFLAAFEATPPTTRITVVTGQEDAGVPFEIFGFGRGEFDLVARTKSTSKVSRLLTFLNDSRLVHWFGQNFDGFGCSRINGGLCAPRQYPLREAVRSLVRSKMSPIPIGLEYHSDRPGMPAAPCDKEKLLLQIGNEAKPLFQRKRKLLITFGCADTKDRRDACSAFKGSSFVDHNPLEQQDDVFRHMAEYAFVAAPEGHGMDTHRFWEILAVGSIPVVRSDPLDVLRQEFPAVLLKQWRDAESQVFDHMDQLIDRYSMRGPEGTWQRMTTEYWISHMRRVHAMKTSS